MACLPRLDLPENWQVPYAGPGGGIEPHSNRGENALSTQRSIVYRGGVVDLGVETADLPDGRSLQLEVVRHPGGAAVVAVDSDARVCLLRQYRHAGGGWLWEVPAGKLEPGEAPLATAQRELAEEAGVRSSRWISLGTILTTPGFCDERIHLFLARDLVAVPQAPGEHELLEVHWVPWGQALERAIEGDIDDAKTLAGLFRAAARLGWPEGGR